MNVRKMQADYEAALETLNNIKQEIEKNDDYYISNGKIMKKDEEKYYLEFLVYAETKYESSGFYTLNKIYKFVEPDMFEILKKFIETRSDEELRHIANKLFILEDTTAEEHKILNKYTDDFYQILQNYNWYHFEDGEVETWQDEEDDQNLFDITFTNDYSGSHGYVSLIKTREDLSGKDQKIEIEKYYKENY